MSRMLPLMCQQCGRTFTYPHQLRRHRKVHTLMNKTMYRCKVCNKTFTYLAHLRQHLSIHFNRSSDDDLYMDDLAIGVTIEPVRQVPSVSTVKPACGCPKVQSNCGAQGLCFDYSQGRSGSGCGPRYGSCHMASCCCSRMPGSRCGSVLMINPQHVVHVDTTHDPTLSYPSTLSCPWDMETSGQHFSESLYQQGSIENKEDEHDADDSFVGPGSPWGGREDESCHSQESLSRDSAVVHRTEKVVMVGDAGSVKDANLTVDASSPPEYHGAGGDGDEVVGFDDMATCHDLANLFPDFNEKGEGKSHAQSKPGNNIDKPVNNNEDKVSLVYQEEDRIPPTPRLETNSSTSPKEVGQRTDLSSSDLEACVKFGLDSKAINPMVVVNDLQREIARLHQAGGEDAFTCNLCDIRFESRMLLLKHIRSHEHMIKKASHNMVEAEHDNETRVCTNPKDKGDACSRSRSNKFNHRNGEDLVKKYIAIVGKTTKKPGPKFRVTVSKLTIKCYICGRLFTTKQHFIVHAKKHLKQLGYSQIHKDLYYCVICYAFYPRENELREHIVDIHGNMEEEEEEEDRRLSEMPTDPYKDSHGSSTFQNGVREIACSSQTNITSGNADPRTDESDSDLAESTTDQLIFPEHEHDSNEVGQASACDDDQGQDTWSGICHVCGAPFSCESKLERHLSNGNCKMEAAKTCERQLASQDSKTKIICASNSHVGKKIGFTCHICGRIFETVEFLKAHFVKHHPERTQLKCPMFNCEGTYVWKQNFKRHLLRHATPKGQVFHDVNFDLSNEIRCPFCNETLIFASIDDYKLHMLEHVNRIMVKECAANDLSFDSIKSMKRMNRFAVINPHPESTTQTHGRTVGNGSRAATTILMDDAKTTKHTILVPKAAHSSTPKSYLGFGDDFTNDVKGGVSIQENPGLFISPVWSTTSNTGGESRHIFGYPQPKSQVVRREVPTTLDSKFQQPSSMDLNDSGFTQTFSGESDLGEVSRELTPQQMLPSFSSFSRNFQVANPAPQATSTQGSHAGSRHVTDGGGSRYGTRVDSNSYSANEDGQAYTLGGESCSTAADGLRFSTTTVGSQPYPTDVGDGRPFSKGSVNAFSSGVRTHKPGQRMTCAVFISLDRIMQLMTNSNNITSNFKSEGQLCSICGKVKLTMDSVKRHLLAHFDKTGKFDFIRRGKKFECPLCFKVILDRRSAMAHLFSHWGQNIIRCPDCGRMFNRVKTLRIHLFKHHPSFSFTPSAN